MESPQPLLQQFDQVELITVRNVSYLSAKPGHSPSPHGLWSVIGLVDGQALIAKAGALIRIPLNDIRKVSVCNRDEIIDRIKGVCFAKPRRADEAN